ncbi:MULTISPECIES: 30S ribosomal protein S16 [unclassified Wenzhouxiangella]|uniref:30S ribosomal protein S16 n=1 Tax=unclassified Wenzhouxiangella TaxID=2613841 RepID=UPI000E3278AB|nr:MULTISPECIES: 30S ribosomal protein S16 [unclassified Wenzhouxiangella]RFF26398.1 30S ribosomal protein S16 [Wenzhouxiangella sp. 15181]RFP67329.1 30S ribosomal protein S16 [Wenzhouxiangella sp. 15190]
MVKIRMSRGGAKKQPFYHIVVTDSRNARDSRPIERLGFFNPVARGQNERLRLDVERVEYWLDQGAQISERVRDLANEARRAQAAA